MGTSNFKAQTKTCLLVRRGATIEKLVQITKLPETARGLFEYVLSQAYCTDMCYVASCSSLRHADSMYVSSVYSRYVALYI